MNDLGTYSSSVDSLDGLFTNKIKPFIRAFHIEFPNAKVLFSTLPLGSINGGFGSAYGADYFWQYYKVSRYLWKFSELAHEMEGETEFSSYFFVADVLPLFDSENLYPVTNKTVVNRSQITESIGTEAVHPLLVGSYTVSDAIYQKISEIL